MKKAAAYLRVSTLSQDYERQRNEINDYCKKYELDLVKVYEEKISGAKDERPQFHELCELTKADIDCVIVWEISRLGRKLTTVIKAVEDFREKGIDVISLKENFQLFDRNGKESTSSMIMMSLFSTMAVIERENIIERTKSGKIDKLKGGELEYTDAPPFGYKLIDKRLVIDEGKAEVVKKVYNEYINGLSQTKIAKAYNLHQSQVARILLNPVYCGQPFSKLLNKTLVAPKIVSVDTYITAREICENRTIKRSKTGTIKYILKCKVFCNICNHVLSKKGECFGCHCGKSNIQEHILVKASEMVVDAYKEVMRNSDDAIKMNEKKASLDKKYISNRRLIISVEKELKDAKAKLKLLSDVFTLENLKKEVAEVNRLKKQLNDLYKELQRLNHEMCKVANAMNADMNYIGIDDITEKVVLHTIDRAKKRLQYFLIDGSIYNVTVRPRKKEYKIEKEQYQDTGLLF